uniref:Carbohydrate sulfotransferase n=1 Tax=Lates calcarifer TaxID=8187 RepID=A0A4W6E9J1_LATCA
HQCKPCRTRCLAYQLLSCACPAHLTGRDEPLPAFFPLDAPADERMWPQRKLLKTSPPISHTSDSPENQKMLSDIMEARRKLMKEMCAKYKSSISRTITRQHVTSLFVEDRYKLLYCQVPKAGCSNWKRTLMVLAGQASNVQSINHDTVHYGNHLKTLNSFDQKGIMHRLETYTKVMFVREPLERMVSAYRDNEASVYLYVSVHTNTHSSRKWFYQT